MFSPPTSNENMINGRPKLCKVGRVFKDCSDIEECYWDAKMYQRNASKNSDRLGYVLIGFILDKMIKHATVFSLSKPTPSEADVMIKIWADLFEVLFYNTGIYARWGEKGLNMDDIKKIFRLDAKLVLLCDEEEYPVAYVKFAPYAGSRK